MIRRFWKNVVLIATMPEKQEGGLRTDSYFALLQGGEGGPGLVAGE